MKRIFSTLHVALFSLALLVSASFVPQTTFAQGNPQVITPGLINPITGKSCDFVTGNISAGCIPLFIGHIIQLVFGLISAFFLLNVIFAGYQIAMGSWTGDKANGKDRLTWSIIGLVISICAFLILDLVVSVIVP